MQSENQTPIHPAAIRLRESMERIRESLPRRGSPLAHRHATVTGWLQEGLDALDKAALTLEGDPTLARDPLRSIQWLVAVAASLLWMEETALTAGLSWPQDALSVRPELRDHLREVVSSPSSDFARAA